MSIFNADPADHNVLARCSYLVLIGLVSCARADSPEAFVADPSMLSDFTSNLPSTGSSLGFNYHIVQGQAILEGDIVLGAVDSEGKLPLTLTGRGVGNTSALSRWPDGIVVYEAPVNGSLVQQDNVEAAIQHWIDNTTMTFVERTDENADQYPNYLTFVDSSGCASHVGMIGGEQPVFIADACSVGSVIHEIGHAVGLFHEHTRPDRDNFVTIDYDEIVDGKEINFDLLTSGVTQYSEYDYGSIMHYGRTFFSKSGNPTIIVDDSIEIGQREALSVLDIESANNMYETDLAVTVQIEQTGDGEYEINLSTYNYGELGANNIELDLNLDKALQYNSISEDSGWECVPDDENLYCTKDTFEEQTQSLFSVQVSTLTEITEDDLRVRLSSRTQDFDESNNTINDDGSAWDSSDSEDSDSGSALDALQTRSVDNSESPQLQAANEPADSESTSSEEEESASGTDSSASSSGSTASSSESTASSSESTASSSESTDSSSGSTESSSSSTANSSGSTTSNSDSDTSTVASSTSTTEASSSGGSLSLFIVLLLGTTVGLRRTLKPEHSPVITE